MKPMHSLLAKLLASSPIRPQAHRLMDVDGVRTMDVIRVWPEPACFRHTAWDGWQQRCPQLHVRLADEPPDDDESAGDDEIGWSVPLSPLFAAIPVHVRNALMPQDVGICWAALRLTHEVPAVLDLMRDLPTLGGLLAMKADDHADRTGIYGEIRVGLARPRKHLLPLVELEPRQRVIRILRRLDPWALGMPGPASVDRVLKDETPLVKKWLSHLPRLRPDVMIVLGASRLLPLATFELLADPSEAIYFGLHVYLRMVLEAREEGDIPNAPARFRSRQELLELCLHLPPRGDKRWDPAEFPGPFSHPTDAVAVPGRPEIALEPVRTAEDMMKRAVPNGLCIATQRRYAERAQAGDGALYIAAWTSGLRRVEATVWLRLSLAKGWRMTEAALSCNRAVPGWLVERLTDWAEAIERGLSEPLVEAPPKPLFPRQLWLPLKPRHSPFDIPSAYSMSHAASQTLPSLGC